MTDFDDIKMHGTTIKKKGYSPHQSSNHSVHSFVGNENHVIIFGIDMRSGLVRNQCSVVEYHTGK
jgi:hypothetical protein